MDIVHEILERVRVRIAEAYGMPEEVADLLGMVEAELKQELGGLRVNIKKPPSNRESKARAVTRGYLAGIPVEAVAIRQGISRATLYRYLKRRD
jgi:hypothetical protein